MTSFSVARQRQGACEEEAVRTAGRDEDETPCASGVPENIGRVEAGSLEEAIWRELGALPRSCVKAKRRANC